MHDTRHSTCSLLEVLSRARFPLRAYRYGLLHGLMASHVTSLPVSVGGAIRQRLPVQMSASEAKGSRAPRTQRDEGADPARRKAWNSSASRGMYHLHLTGAGEHSNRLGPTGRHDGVRLLHPKLISCLLGTPAAAAAPGGPCWSACSSPRRLRQINRLPRGHSLWRNTRHQRRPRPLGSRSRVSSTKMLWRGSRANRAGKTAARMWPLHSNASTRLQKLRAETATRKATRTSAQVPAHQCLRSDASTGSLKTRTFVAFLAAGPRTA